MIRTLPITLLEIVCKRVLNFQGMVKDLDDNVKIYSEALMV